MPKTEGYISVAAKEYEKLTVPLSMEVGSIIFSVRSLKNNLLTMSNTISKISEDTYTDTPDDESPLLRQEIKNLINTLHVLKQTVKFNLCFIMRRITISLFETVIANNLTPSKVRNFMRQILSSKKQ
ncbi:MULTISPECIES: hypothetical protein [unclassified Pseudomonas]|uniref:hypothetical protein n=1 Tax=unclassified Pseudomonas TaxID=196821 RepID=UPI002E8205CB|nr:MULTISPECIES: hypothetical protein [unclassified Pseudomonas]